MYFDGKMIFKITLTIALAMSCIDIRYYKGVLGFSSIPDLKTMCSSFQYGYNILSYNNLCLIANICSENCKSCRPLAFKYWWQHTVIRSLN